MNNLNITEEDYTITIKDGVITATPKQLNNQYILFKKEEKLHEFGDRYDFTYGLSGYGCVINCWQTDEKLGHYNTYPTAKMAGEVAKIQRYNNAIVLACKLVDPDYKPDWFNACEVKYTVDYDYRSKVFGTDSWTFLRQGICYVSSKEKAEAVIKLLNQWGVKPE